MSGAPSPVSRALDRWERKGLVDAGLADTLRREADTEAKGQARRWSQYLLAATGGAVLVVAGGTFLAWAWPEMGYAGQSVTLAVMGLAVLGLGFRLPSVGRLRPVAYLLQLAGTVLILMALFHSENAWPDGSLEGWGVALFGLGITVILFPLAVGENHALAGVQAVLSFLFLFLFFHRGPALDEETVLWILDGIFLLVMAALVFRLRRADAPLWILSVFWALLLGSVVLIGSTGSVVWEMESEVMYLLDGWLLTVAALSFLGQGGRTPAHLRRGWYEHLLAACIAAGIPFVFITMLETADAEATPTALLVAVVGASGLWFSLPRGSRSVLAASCLALLIAAWYWGAEMSGALGAVGALTVVSVALFWGAGRMGRFGNGSDRERGTTQDA